MQFHEFRTNYDVARHAVRKAEGNRHSLRNTTASEFYEQHLEAIIPRVARKDQSAISTYNLLFSERNYIEDGRPYYLVYPGIVPYLCRMKEDKVPANLIQLPKMALAFRFADTETFFNFEHENRIYSLKALLANYNTHELKLGAGADSGKPERVESKTFTIWMDFGETDPHGFPVYEYQRLVLREGYTVEQAVNELRPNTLYQEVGVRYPEEVLRNVICCVVGCCLVSQDRDDGLIERDVLTNDRDAYQRTGDAKYEERAEKRGKLGWRVGFNIEVNPHWRGPSPLALYWTGKGRTVPSYRYRKGTIVHRKKVRDLPTGLGEISTDTEEYPVVG
jgi:hypothetical protein